MNNLKPKTVLERERSKEGIADDKEARLHQSDQRKSEREIKLKLSKL